MPEQKNLSEKNIQIVIKAENGHNLIKNGDLSKELMRQENGNGHLKEHNVILEPPDGGMRGWLVMVSAFLCNGIVFGIINCYGLIHSLLTDRLTAQGDTEASSKAALVGSLTIGTTFLFSAVAGCLTDKIGLRITTFLGGIMCTSGLLLSSFVVDNINALYVTYGFMFGLGSALTYTPSIAILGHYFKRYLGKVSGVVAAGSSIFTIILPDIMEYFVKNYGLEVTLQIMAATAAFIIFCALVYKPLHPPPPPPKSKPGRSRANTLMRSVVNVDIWKRKKYVIWASCLSLALFGYFVPYVHMVKFVKTTFPGENSNLPVMCIGITSGIGRLLFGTIADMKRVNRIFLQQMALVCIGIVTILLALTNNYVLLIVYTLIMGLFDGCFIALLGPIAYEICGSAGATQAIGFVLCLSSVPLTVGPPFAGKIFDSTGTYKMPFILAGIPPLVGAALIFAILCIPGDATKKRSKYNIENGGMKNDLKTMTPLVNGHIEVSTQLTEEVVRIPHAETGIEMQNVKSAFKAALVDIELHFPSTACHYYSSSNTALLSSSCISSVVVDDCSIENVQLYQKRRYSYSIF